MFSGIGIPLYDFAAFSPLWQGMSLPVDRCLSVSGVDGDRRHSLAVPVGISDETAIATARRRGWRVHGIWRRAESLLAQ